MLVFAAVKTQTIINGSLSPQRVVSPVRGWRRRPPGMESSCEYTGCPRRNVKYFGRVFLMLNYTDITQNTYVQSLTVTEIMAREKCGHLAFLRTARLQLCSALTLTEQCSTHLCACTSSAQRDKIVFHYCRYSCAMYSAW